MASGRLQDKIAVITGGSSGIGRAIAVAYAREGAKVVVGDLKETSSNPEENESTSDFINHEAGAERCIFGTVDVRDARSVEALIAQAVAKWGRLDIMVNNAGIGLEANDPQPVWKVTDKTWDLTLAINGTGVFNGIRAATAHMIEQQPNSDGDRGWIINMSSIYGQVGMANTASYCASKHLVIGLTKSAALDCAPQRIHVNAICPGYIKSSLSATFFQEGNEAIKEAIDAAHPFGGIGMPNDVARVAVMLASRDAGWITGTAITVDGGYTTQ